MHQKKLCTYIHITLSAGNCDSKCILPIFSNKHSLALGTGARTYLPQVIHIEINIHVSAGSICMIVVISNKQLGSLGSSLRASTVLYSLTACGELRT